MFKKLKKKFWFYLNAGFVKKKKKNTGFGKNIY